MALLCSAVVVQGTLRLDEIEAQPTLPDEGTAALEEAAKAEKVRVGGGRAVAATVAAAGEHPPVGEQEAGGGEEATTAERGVVVGIMVVVRVVDRGEGKLAVTEVAAMQVVATVTVTEVAMVAAMAVTVEWRETPAMRRCHLGPPTTPLCAGGSPTCQLCNNGQHWAHHHLSPNLIGPS